MITFVNDFTVTPDKQKDSLRTIQNVYRVVRHQPGFISARLFTSDDGTKITVIALWDTQEQLAAARQIPEFQDFSARELSESVVSNDAHVYSSFVEIPGVLHKHKY